MIRIPEDLDFLIAEGCRSMLYLTDISHVIYWLNEKEQEEVLSQPEELLESFEPEASDWQAEGLFKLAAAADFLGEAMKFRFFCRKALEKNMNHFPSLYALGLEAFRRSKNDEAKRLLSRALRKDPQASDSILHFQKQLRSHLGPIEASVWSSWCLEELHRAKKSSDETNFELAKVLFEQSRWDEACQIFENLLSHPDLNQESSQYLSYIYERLYQGEELIDRYLQMAGRVADRADLFFNLGMIFQNDRRYRLQSLHFFYLSHREDPHDPGLRFSLEQACMEHIGRSQDARTQLEFLELMFAHLYYGSVAVAERYAQSLRKRWRWQFPQSFLELHPQQLWADWLFKESSRVGSHSVTKVLQQWFGELPQESWKITGQD